jgi:hypothetical protein
MANIQSPMSRRGFLTATALTAAVPVIGVTNAGTGFSRAAPATGRSAESASAVVLQWYDLTNQAVAAAAYAEPVTQSRAWAISWLAAARAIRRDSGGQFTIAAFASALHDVLISLVPAQQSQLDAGLATTLAILPDGPAKSRGVAEGQYQAAAVIAQRAGDGLDAASVDIPWTPPPASPGVWQPTPPSFGPAIRAGEGKARPFLLTSDSQFRPGPPPALTSGTYLRSLAEVYSIGGAVSTIRTKDQTSTALFWEPASNVIYVQVLRAAVAGSGLPFRGQVALVAAFHVITTDAQIAIYDAKYTYVFWRPVTAIQTGAFDHDPGWETVFPTPRHPEYPSGHCGYAGAAERALTAFLGPRVPQPVSATSPDIPGVTHSYESWAQITEENVNARVWGGIHFRSSDETGVDVGRQVAAYDLARLSSIGIPARLR